MDLFISFYFKELTCYSLSVEIVNGLPEGINMHVFFIEVQTTSLFCNDDMYLAASSVEHVLRWPTLISHGS